MTRFYSVNFSRLPEISSLASTGYRIVLYGGQNPFKEEIRNYVIQLFSSTPRRLIEASSEDCLLHKWNVCLDQLANHATQKKNEANLKKVEVVLSCLGGRIVLLKARRYILTFEQLRFDCGDKVAQALFDDSS